MATPPSWQSIPASTTSWAGTPMDLTERMTRLQQARNARHSLHGGAGVSGEKSLLQSEGIKTIEANLSYFNKELGPGPPRTRLSPSAVRATHRNIDSSRKVSDTSRRMIQESLALVQNPIATLSSSGEFPPTAATRTASTPESPEFKMHDDRDSTAALQHRAQYQSLHRQIAPLQTAARAYNNTEVSEAVKRSLQPSAAASQTVLTRRTEELEQRIQESIKLCKDQIARPADKLNRGQGQPATSTTSSVLETVKAQQQQHQLQLQQRQMQLQKEQQEMLERQQQERKHLEEQQQARQLARQQQLEKHQQQLRDRQLQQQQMQQQQMLKQAQLLKERQRQMNRQQEQQEQQDKMELVSPDTRPLTKVVTPHRDQTPVTHVQVLPRQLEYNDTSQIEDFEPVMLEDRGGSPISINGTDLALRQAREEEQAKWDTLKKHGSHVQDIERLLDLRKDYLEEETRIQKCEVGLLLERKLFSDKLAKIKQYSTARLKQLGKSYKQDKEQDEGILLDAVLSIIRAPAD